jgi:predicted HTH transcriptional regulator
MTEIAVQLTDAELMARMRNFEDHFVERKTAKDEKDWKKTAVAFANSAPIGFPAVLYVGVRNNGEIETPQHDLDELQRKFNARMQRVYPRIAYVPKIVTENGRQALAIIIPGSESKPHFAGLSYIRKGSETFEASGEQFDELLEERQSKTRINLRSQEATLVLVNLHWITVRVHFNNLGDADFSEPLDKLLLSWDDSQGHLKIEVA